MKITRILPFILLMTLLQLITSSEVYCQREGKITRGSITKHLLLANGPQGPVKGGESAVTDMVLLNDAWVYGSTKATWGAANCHIFRTDGDKTEHLLNLTSILAGQTAISDLCPGTGNTLVGCTSTYDDILGDQAKGYEGGHLFSFDPHTMKITDLGIMASGQGINCIVSDTARGRVFGVTYPAGHLFCYDMKSGKIIDFGEIMRPWKVKDLGRISWRGVPKVLILDDAGTLYFSTYFNKEVSMAKQELMNGGESGYSSFSGGLICRLASGDDHIYFTGASVPTQKGMDSDPLYENGIASAIRARDGGFWCGTINDGFLFRFHPSTSTVINKGKAFQYWNLKSLAYGNDGKLYMLGGRDEDNSWIMSYDPATGSIDCLGWPDNTAQCSIICADSKGRILIAENTRFSFIWVYEPQK